MRAAVVAAVAVVALAPYPPQAPLAPNAHHHVGETDPQEIAAAQAAAEASYRARERSGRDGAGSTVTHTAGSRHASPSERIVPRLFRTGILGFEPTLGVAPDGTVYSQGQRRNVTLESVVVRSRNRGGSWSDASPRVSSGDDWKHSYTQDPYLYVDSQTGRVFTSDLLFPGPGQMFSYSDDRGKTWTTSIVGAEQTDHQTVFAGPPSEADKTSGYPNVVYNCAANVYATAVLSAATTCIKSLDGGDTWRLTGTPPYVNDPRAGPGTGDAPGWCAGLTGHGFVGHDGTVYLPRGFCEQPWLAISRDGGLTWTRVQVADNGMGGSDSGPPEELPQPSHEAGVVADRRGNIYYTWVAMDLLPYLAVSRDGGETWSKPVCVSPPGVTQTSLPGIAIAPKAPVGKIAMIYMGSTNAPGAPYEPDEAAYAGATWNAYVTVTQDALATRPTFHTASLNDPADPLVIGKCGTLRCGAEYDFIDVQIDRNGTPWAAVIDGCIGGCTNIGQLVIGRLDGIRLR